MIFIFFKDLGSLPGIAGILGLHCQWLWLDLALPPSTGTALHPGVVQAGARGWQQPLWVPNSFSLGMPLLLIHPIITPKPLCTCGIPELLPLSVAREGCPHHSRGTVPLTVPLPSLQLQPGPSSSSQEASETFVWAVQSDWDEAPPHPPAPPETTQGHG